MRRFANDRSGAIAVVGALAMAVLLGAGLVGSPTIPFTVRSAASAASAVPVCVLSLDPSSPQGIEIYGTAQFTAPSYIFVTEKMWFQDNSVIEVWQENSRGLDIPAPSPTIMRGAQLTK